MLSVCVCVNERFLKKKKKERKEGRKNERTHTTASCWSRWRDRATREYLKPYTYKSNQ